MHGVGERGERARPSRWRGAPCRRRRARRALVGGGEAGVERRVHRVAERVRGGELGAGERRRRRRRQIGVDVEDEQLDVVDAAGEPLDVGQHVVVPDERGGAEARGAEACHLRRPSSLRGVALRVDVLRRRRRAARWDRRRATSSSRRLVERVVAHARGVLLGVERRASAGRRARRRRRPRSARARRAGSRAPRAARSRACRARDWARRSRRPDRSRGRARRRR